MKYVLALLLLLAAPISLGPASAHDIDHDGLLIDHPILFPPLGNPTMTVGYMRLVNKTDKADRLVAVRADFAQRIEIHTHKKDGDVMRMRRVEGVDLPAGGEVVFQSGGHHLMIFGLHEPLVVGDELEVELEFERSGTVVAPFWVESRADHVAENGGEPDCDKAKRRKDHHTHGDTAHH